MADWQTPKTNWQAGDIPTPADFNRAEGNTKYLKTQTDGLKSGSIKAAKASNADNAGYATNAGYADGAHVSDFVLPSNTVILRSYVEGPGDGLRKIFRVKYPGIYRIQVNAILENRAGITGTIRVKIIHPEQEYSFHGNTPGGSFGGTTDMFVPAGGQIYIYVSTGGSSNDCWIRTCYVLGTLYNHTTAPPNAVLQDS